MRLLLFLILSQQLLHIGYLLCVTQQLPYYQFVLALIIILLNLKSAVQLWILDWVRHVDWDYIFYQRFREQHRFVLRLLCAPCSARGACIMMRSINVSSCTFLRITFPDLYLHLSLWTRTWLPPASPSALGLHIALLICRETIGISWFSILKRFLTCWFCWDNFMSLVWGWLWGWGVVGLR